MTKRFQGFADGDGRFFKALAKNQNREWFQAHKGDYESGWNQPMKDLLADLREAIDGAYAHSDLDEPKVFRIFRDVRWVKLEELPQYDFLVADRGLIKDLAQGKLL